MTAFRALRGLSLIASGTVWALGCARAAHSRADSAAPQATSQATSSPTAATDARTLTAGPMGLGPLRIGASVTEAAAVIGDSIRLPRGADSSGCFYVAWPKGPGQVRIMFEAGRLARIEVDNPAIATADGVRIGDTEASVLARYSGRATLAPAKYTDGHTISVTAPGPSARDYRLVFETDSGRVTRYRVGRMPAVEYVEGCG